MKAPPTKHPRVSRAEGLNTTPTVVQASDLGQISHIARRTPHIVHVADAVDALQSCTRITGAAVMEMTDRLFDYKVLNLMLPENTPSTSLGHWPHDAGFHISFKRAENRQLYCNGEREFLSANRPL